jgi:hypothetical protein
MPSTATTFGGGNTVFATTVHLTLKEFDITLYALPNFETYNKKQPQTFLTSGHTA